MEDSKTAYSVPDGFNPYTAANTVRGLADAIHRFIFEGPGTQRVIPDADRAGLDSLVELLQAEVHALHAYLREIENRTVLDLPTSDEEFDALDVRFVRHRDGVKEPAAVYSISRH